MATYDLRHPGLHSDRLTRRRHFDQAPVWKFQPPEKLKITKNTETSKLKQKLSSIRNPWNSYIRVRTYHIISTKYMHITRTYMINGRRNPWGRGDGISWQYQYINQWISFSCALVYSVVAILQQATAAFSPPIPSHLSPPLFPFPFLAHFFENHLKSR